MAASSASATGGDGSDVDAPSDATAAAAAAPSWHVTDVPSVDTLERFRFRLALVEAEALGGVAERLLPPLFQGVGGGDEARKAALAVISALRTRIRDDHGVKLPTRKLIAAVKAPSGEIPDFARPIVLLFLRAAIAREAAAGKAAAALLLAEGAAGFHPSVRVGLLSMIVDLMGNIEVPGEQSERAAKFGAFLDDPADRKAIVAHFIDQLLYSNPSAPKAPSIPVDKKPRLPAAAGGGADGSGAAAAEPAKAARKGPPPGLSVTLAKQIAEAGGTALTAADIHRRKIAILQLAGAEVFHQTEMLPLGVVSCADSHHEVVRRGEELLKRVPDANLESAALVKTLYNFVLGVPAQKRGACAQGCRLKALDYLCKSRVAAEDFASALKAVFECLFGAQSNIKLQLAALRFAQHVFRRCGLANLKRVAPVFLQGIVKLIAGFVQASKRAVETRVNIKLDTLEVRLREASYTAMGELARRVPSVFVKDLGIARLLFERLQNEDTEARLSVAQALSYVAPAFDKETGLAHRDGLVKLLEANAASPEIRCRQAALEWTCTALPFWDVGARLVCVKLAGDLRTEVREAAMHGLNPWTYRTGSMTRNTDNVPVMDVGVDPESGRLYDELPKLAEVMRVATGGVSVPGAKRSRAGSVSDKIASLSSSSLEAFLQFSARCLRQEAFELAESPTDALAQLQAVVEHGLAIPQATTGAGVVHHASAAVLYRLLQVQPGLIEEYADSVDWLLEWIHVPQLAVREIMARILGHVASRLSESAAATLVDRLAKISRERSEFEVHGALAALGHVVAARSSSSGLVAVGAADGDATMSGAPSGDELRATATVAIIKQLRSSNVASAVAACESLTLVARSGQLPIPARVDGEGSGADVSRAGVVALLRQISAAAGQQRERSVEEKRQEKSKVAKPKKNTSDRRAARNSRLAESAASCVGAIAANESDSELRWSYIESLLSLSKVPYESIQFSVGNALVEATTSAVPSDDATAPLTAAEEASSDVVMEWLLAGASTSAGEGTDREIQESLLEKVLRILLTTKLDSHHAVERTATSIWLLSFIHQAGKLTNEDDEDDMYEENEPVVDATRAVLADLQAAFTRLLGEKSQFTQECAAKGLALLYDMSSRTDQGGLVDSLVGTLTTGKRTSVEGASVSAVVGGSGPAGTSLSAAGDSTYAEMCAFATDVGEPELIYRFLSMASSHALWHTRGGAAYGLEALLQGRARDVVAPHLERLIPRLYRYRYDPAGRMRESMGRLWQALVRDPQKTVSEHLPAIIDEMLRAAASPKRRERQAAYAGLADALLGRQLDEVEAHLGRCWDVLMYGLDDVNEDVRESAQGALKVLARLTVRFADPAETTERGVAATVDAVIPFLCDKGVPSGVSEVRGLCVYYLREITRVARRALAPHATRIMKCALSAMSVMESSSLQYLQIHANAGTGRFEDAMGGMSAEDLESRRVSAAGSGFLGDIVDKCVDNVSAGVLEQVFEMLRELIQSGVGIPTRGAAARTAASIANRFDMQVMKPHAGALMKTLGSCVEHSGTSAAMRREFSSAAASIAKSAKYGTVKKYVERLIRMYGKADNEVAKRSAGSALLRLLKLASERSRRNERLIIPTAWLAMRDADPDSAAVWSDVWDVLSPSSAHTVRLYLDEIVAATSVAIEGSSWTTKRQASEAITAIARVAGTALKAHAPAMLQQLLTATPGRYWEGKSSMLKAIASVATRCQEAISDKAGVIPDLEDLPAAAPGTMTLPHVLRTLLVEARKSTSPADFRCTAMEAIGTIATAFTEADCYAAVNEMLLREIIPMDGSGAGASESKSETSGTKEIDADSKAAQKDAAALRAAAWRCMGEVFPKAGPGAATQRSVAVAAAAYIAEHAASMLWRERLAAISAVRHIFSNSDASVWSEDSLVPIVSGLEAQALHEIKYPLVRAECVKAFMAFVKKLGRTHALVAPRSAKLATVARKLESDVDTRVAAEAVLLGKTLRGGSLGVL